MPKYNHEFLANYLLELGGKLGRSPRPKDLEQGAPSRQTYSRYFGSWNEALRQAGFLSAEVHINPVPNVETGQDSIVDEESSVQLVNLLGKPVVFASREGLSKPLLSSGKAWILRSMPIIPPTGEALGKVIGNILVLTFHEKRILIEDNNGIKRDFPLPDASKVYLVEEKIARAAHVFLRPSYDLVFPKHCVENGGVLYVGGLEMVYTRGLFEPRTPQEPTD